MKKFNKSEFYSGLLKKTQAELTKIWQNNDRINIKIIESYFMDIELIHDFNVFEEKVDLT